jgi:ABC-2 type transport system permease protein
MKKVLAVARKELLQIRRDPLSLLLLIGMPAFLLVLYGFALNFDVRHVRLAVQDRDSTPASRALITDFVSSQYFDLVATPAAGTDLERLLEIRVARAVLVIPQGYSRKLHQNQASPVQLLLDGADANTATTVLGYAGALVAEANATLIGRQLPELSAAPIDYQPRVFYNPELKSSQFLVPGLMGLLLMLTAVLSTALSVVREKERGSLAQLRVAPISTGQIILGKTLPYLGLSLIASGIILVSAWTLFGVVVKGPFLDLFAVTLLYLVGGLGLGLLISTLADSQAMAFQIGLMVSLLPAMLLSGFIFQIRIMPGWLQVLTYLVPARYYLIVLRGIILKGVGLAPYGDQIVALAIFATVVLGLASFRLRSR